MVYQIQSSACSKYYSKLSEKYYYVVNVTCSNDSSADVKLIMFVISDFVNRLINSL